MTRRLDRVSAVREQIEAPVGGHERETVEELSGNLRLFEAWADASAECIWCQTEVEAVGAYAEPLLRGTSLPSSSPGSQRD